MKNIFSIQSHAVFDYAGNTAALFLMWQLGAKVWPLNTVQLSNYIQYGYWLISIMPKDHPIDIVCRISDINWLETCGAVLSGCFGSVEQQEAILESVRVVKEANHKAWYFCDQVIGRTQQECVVESGIEQFHTKGSLLKSDIVVPNFLYLEILSSQCRVKNVHEAITVDHVCIFQGIKIFFIKKLSPEGFYRDQLEVLLVSADQIWHISRALIDFGFYELAGMDDLTNSMLFVNLLYSFYLKSAMGRVAEDLYTVILQTYHMGDCELQLVVEQQDIVEPTINFTAVKALLL
ncbi:pyridoxal kinase [Candidatus Erwinia haradaeae]|uniref:pyridoxal kinase n=1 Tax=Candidatus Erwinia haradaeae TaxID=1922217 RepID=A0A451D8B9_9GAMM|nr:pyridoxal kinase [Candidatus Erwinia haradaeae]VFP82072.1 Pyridoxal kinase PdxY [Candidatus Erwinia haradaeae]